MPDTPPRRFVAPGETPNLTRARFEQMRELRSLLAHLTDQRERIVQENGLDPAFCLPDGNWTDAAGNDFVQAYRHVLRGDYDVLNRLRWWSQVFTGYQIMTLRPGRGLRSVNPVVQDHDEMLRNTHPHPDAWVSHWDHLAAALPTRYLWSPPRMLGETGWDVGGILVNHDTCAYQERINLLHQAHVMDRLRRIRCPRILEIGGGYGALCHALRSFFPASFYLICDLPESLMFSGLYLAGTTGVAPAVIGSPDDRLPDRGVALIPNYLFHRLPRESFDLVINTLSMSEMSRHQINTYAHGISQAISKHGMFFEQNQDNTHLGLQDAKTVLSDCFSHSRCIVPNGYPTVHGAANLWGNIPLEQITEPRNLWRVWRALARPT